MARAESPLTYREAITTWEKMEPHITKTDKGGVYETGWNDARVAEENGVKKATATKVRMQMIGTLAPRVPQQKAVSRGLEARIAALEVELRAQAIRIAKLENPPTAYPTTPDNRWVPPPR